MTKNEVQSQVPYNRKILENIPYALEEAVSIFSKRVTDQYLRFGNLTLGSS